MKRRGDEKLRGRERARVGRENIGFLGPCSRRGCASKRMLHSIKVIGDNAEKNLVAVTGGFKNIYLNYYLNYYLLFKLYIESTYLKIQVYIYVY